jgi:hypothetical protein
MARKSWIAPWNCCNKRQRFIYLTRDLNRVENDEENASKE